MEEVLWKDSESKVMGPGLFMSRLHRKPIIQIFLSLDYCN